MQTTPTQASMQIYYERKTRKNTDFTFIAKQSTISQSET